MSDTQFPLLLRSLIQDTPPESTAPWDIPALWKTAAEQSLLPVLAYENKRWRLFDDADVCRRLDGLLYSAVAGNLNRCVDFEALSKRFTEQGIAHMPVKGYYLRRLYPVSGLRTFGDIDLLIHPEDRAKAHALMCALGYTVGHDWEPTYSYVRDTEYYEIHTNLMDGNLDGRTDLPAYFGRAWQYAERDDGLRYRPAPEFHFIYTVCHLAKHLYGGGAGLRMYLDAALFVKQEDARLDWAAIMEEFSALHMTAFFHTVMNACRVWFGTETVCPLPEPDHAALEKLLDYTLDADLFGLSRDHAVIELGGCAVERPRAAADALSSGGRDRDALHIFEGTALAASGRVDRAAVCQSAPDPGAAAPDEAGHQNGQGAGGGLRQLHARNRTLTAGRHMEK